MTHTSTKEFAEVAQENQRRMDIGDALSEALPEVIDLNTERVRRGLGRVLNGQESQVIELTEKEMEIAQEVFEEHGRTGANDKESFILADAAQRKQIEDDVERAENLEMVRQDTGMRVEVILESDDPHVLGCMNPSESGVIYVGAHAALDGDLVKRVGRHEAWHHKLPTDYGLEKMDSSDLTTLMEQAAEDLSGNASTWASGVAGLDGTSQMAEMNRGLVEGSTEFFTGQELGKDSNIAYFHAEVPFFEWLDGQTRGAGLGSVKTMARNRDAAGVRGVIEGVA